MKSITISGRGEPSTIHVGERLENLPEYLPDTRVAVITDETVWDLYGPEIKALHVIRIGCGEKIKTLETAHRIYGELLAMGADRSWFLVGVGGGIVCDITGFVASTFMRGVGFGFVATTLLAQVDASVGGKNGVNFQGYKNLIGVFNQPRFVLCDPHLLATLPPREIGCGLAEVVKHAAIGIDTLFGFLETHHQAAKALDPEIIERLVHDSVVLKATIVSRDETETGERRKLNFGHTFGHAIERVHGFPHGQAVSAGMVIAADLSVDQGFLAPTDVRRLEALLTHLHLPTRPVLDRPAVGRDLQGDKKREGEQIHFVFLEGIGRAVVQKVPVQWLVSRLA